MTQAELDIFLNNIIESRPEDVSQLLLDLGEEVEATPENLKKAYLVYGDNFIEALTCITEDLDLDELEEVDSFLGIGKLFKKKSGTKTKKEKATPEERKSKLSNIFGTAVTLAGVFGSFKKNKSDSPEDSSYKISTKPREKEEEKTILGMPQPLAIGLGLVVALVLVFVAIKFLPKTKI
jgi:hypothetical protein